MNPNWQLIHKIPLHSINILQIYFGPTCGVCSPAVSPHPHISHSECSLLPPVPCLCLETPCSSHLLLVPLYVSAKHQDSVHSSFDSQEKKKKSCPSYLHAPWYHFYSCYILKTTYLNFLHRLQILTAGSELCI